MYLSLSTHPIRACPPQPPPSLPSSASITADRNLSPAYIFTHATYATSALLAFQLSAPAFSPTPPSAHASFAHVIALTDPRPQFPARRVLACLRPHARRSPSPHSRSLASIDHSSLPFPHYRLHSSPKRIYPSTHHRVPFPAHCVSPLARSSLSLAFVPRSRRISLRRLRVLALSRPTLWVSDPDPRPPRSRPPLFVSRSPATSLHLRAHATSRQRSPARSSPSIDATPCRTPLISLSQRYPPRKCSPRTSPSHLLPAPFPSAVSPLAEFPQGQGKFPRHSHASSTTEAEFVV